MRFGFRHGSRVWALALGMLAFALASCDEETAGLTVSIPTTATATPQFFHGNCAAGWSVAVELRVRETGGVEVVLDELRYRVFDTGITEELGAEALDRATLIERYGTTAAVLPGGSTRSFPLGFPTEARPLGPLEVSGSLSGRDENGRAITAAFDLATPITVSDDPPPEGGACP